MLSHLGLYLSLTRNDQKCVFMGKVFGYLFSKNSTDERTQIYQYIWNIGNKQGFNKVQTRKFFSSFQEGKTISESQLEQLFLKSKNIWERDSSNIALFNQMVIILFFDNALTQKERNTFLRIARFMGINESTRNKIFESYITKYHFEYDETSENYFGNADFSEFSSVESVEYTQNDKTNSPEQTQHNNTDLNASVLSAYMMLKIPINATQAEATDCYLQTIQKYKLADSEQQKLSEVGQSKYLNLQLQLQQAWNTVQAHNKWN